MPSTLLYCLRMSCAPTVRQGGIAHQFRTFHSLFVRYASRDIRRITTRILP